MKQPFLILILILSLSLSSNAQRFQGGLLGGLVSSQVDGDMAAGYNKAGFQAGAFVRYQMYSNIALQAELRFIQKGALENRAKTDGYYYRSSLNYVEMPITWMIKKGKFYFEIGPALGILVSGKEEDAYGELSLGNYEPFNSVEVSAVGGFFYEINEKWVLSFRGQYSITPIRQRVSDNVTVLYPYQKYAFNNLLSFGVYYFFDKD